MDTIRLLINSIHSDSSLSNHFNSFIKRAGHQDYKSKNDVDTPGIRSNTCVRQNDVMNILYHRQPISVHSNSPNPSINEIYTYLTIPFSPLWKQARFV